MANELHRRYALKELHATSVHAGAIATNLSRHLGDEFVNQLLSNEVILKVLKSCEQGATMTGLVAAWKDDEGKGGRYLEDCREAERGEDDNDAFGTDYVLQIYGTENERRL